MPVSFVVAAQWQGSGSARAMRLVDGAEAIRGDLPSASTRVVDIPLEAGDSQGSSVHRLSSVTLVRDRLAQLLAELDSAPIIVGGDCGVDLAGIAHALDRYGDDVAVLWIDAHPDLNTPASSESGAFHGMVLSTLLGDGVPSLVPAVRLRADRVVLVGTRAADAAEDRAIAEYGIRVIEPDQVAPAAVLEALAATGASAVYLHIDLDVLDPGEFLGLGFPEPFGVSSAELVSTIKAVLASYPLAGAALTEFAPASADEAVEDAPTILRIIGALTR